MPFISFDEELKSTFVDFSRPEVEKPEESAWGALKRGATESFQQLPQLARGVQAGIGAAAESVLGEGGIATGIKKSGIEGYKAWGDKIAEKSQESDSIDYSWDKAKEGDFGSLVNWLAHGLGYVGGQAVQTLATGGIGAVGGKFVAGTAAKQIAEGMVAKEAARLTAENAGLAVGERLAADAIAKAATQNVAAKFATIGATTALAASATGMEGGEIFGGLTSENPDRVLTGNELGKAFASTLAAGGLEFVGDKLGLDIMLGKSSLLKPAQFAQGMGGRAARGLIAGGAAAPIEAGTEYLQTGLEEFGKGKEQNILPFNQSEEAQKQAREGAALGALGGGVIGGLGGGLRGAKERPEPKPEPHVADILDAPSVDDAIGKASEILDTPITPSAIDAGRQFQDLGITAPADDLAMQRQLAEAESNLTARGQVQSEREGAAASRARDQRLQDAGKAWQDLGVTNPSDDLQAQRMGLRESQDVSENPDLQQLPASSTGRGSPELGVGLEAALGRDGDADGAVGTGLPGAVSPGESVAPVNGGDGSAVGVSSAATQQSESRSQAGQSRLETSADEVQQSRAQSIQTQAAPREKSSLAGVADAVSGPSINSTTAEPAKTWFGRKGDGYVTEGDAVMALLSRQKIEPDLNWRVEQMPSGKFRLAGYAGAGVKSGDAANTDSVASPQNTSALPDASRAEPVRVSGTPSNDRSAAGLVQDRPRTNPSFDFTRNATGTLTVHGDPAAIRAAGINGVVKFDAGKPTGILVSVNNAPAVSAQLEAARVQNNTENPANIEATPTQARAEAPEVAGSTTGQAADSAAGSGAVQAVAQKQPWEMSRKEWEAERDKIRPDTVQSNLTKVSGSQAAGRAQALQDILYGVTDEASSRLKAAQKGDIELSETELEDITNRLNTRVSHSDVIAKAIAEGRPVPQEVLAEYPDLQPQGTANAQAAEAIEAKPSAPTQAAADPRLTPVSQRTKGAEIDRYIGQHKKGMGMHAAKLEASRLNRANKDASITYTAEEHNDPKLENPWAVFTRKVEVKRAPAASPLDVPSDKQAADAHAAVDALTDDEAKAAAVRMGKKLTPRMDAKDALKQEHPDDVAHVLAGDSWNGKGWDKAVEPIQSTQPDPNQASIFDAPAEPAADKPASAMTASEHLRAAADKMDAEKVGRLDNIGETDGRGDDIQFSKRGTNEPMTNKDVVGNQGGRSADDSTPGVEPLRLAPYTHAEMIARGADGNLSRGYERYVPIDKLDGLEPVPSNNESDDGEYHPGTPITQPIEVQANIADGTFIVYSGNHRIAQAKANGQTHILAFVEPDPMDGRGVAKGSVSRTNPDANESTAPDSGGAMFSRMEDGITRREALIAAIAAATNAKAQASTTLGKAKPVSAAVLSQQMSPTVAKILRGNGATNPDGAKAVKNALMHIAVSGPVELRAFVQQISSMLPKEGFMLTVDDVGLWNAHGAVRFKPLPELLLFTAEGRTGLTYETFLHELLHMVVAAKYKTLGSTLPSNYAKLQRKTPAAMAQIEQFNALWREFGEVAKGRLDGVTDKDMKLSLREAMNNPDEFFVRSLTEPRFQAFLSGIEYKGKTLLQRFKDWVKTSLFGFKTEGVAPSWLDAALLASNEVMEAAGRDASDFATMGAMNDFMGNKGQHQAMLSRSVITGQALPQAWQAPDATKMDDFIYSMQDKHVDTKRITQAVRAAIGNIADNINPYLQEELYHGRAAMATKEFLEKEIRPFLTDLQARGIDMSDFEEYLHNRHAERRNVQVAKVNTNMQDGGSGIDTADARAYLAGLPATKKRAYEALAAKVDQINRDTRALLVSSGLEKQSTIDAWQAAYGDEYVPLMREEMDNGMGIGQGFSVRGGSSKRAMGSNKPVANIIANIALQREKAITRSEKQRIGHALYGMVLSAPNDDFWLAIDPKLQQNPAQILATASQLVSIGMNPADADSIAREPTTRYINPQTGLVDERINPALRSADNVLAVRIDGEDKYVFFNAKDERAMRMAKALKNLDADQLGSVMGTVAKMTRWFSAVNTQYNPIFGVTNITRDVQTALLNLESTALKGHKADVMKHILPALRGIYIDLRDHRAGKQPTSAYAQIFEEFQREGGATGYRDMYANAQERADAIKDELADINAGKLKQLGKGVMGWLSDYNESMENAVRVSAYKVGVEQGLTKQQAASLAKNLTVNFNRKGQVALQAGALYAFFNASVQGTARIAETLFEGGKLSAVGKKIITGGLLLGSMQALLLAAAGFDDDEPPDFVRERNLVIPIGDKKYITIPMPLGFHVLPNIARIPTEWAMGGFRSTPKRIGQMVGLFADAFNPIGSAGLSLQTLTPTIIDPLAALSENKDFTGRPIAKKDFDPMHPTAGHTRAKDSATPWAKFISQAVNFATGGTDYKPGLASPTPDQIDYLIGQVTGGVGREVGKATQVIGGSVSGEDVPLHKIPLVGRFVGTTEGQSAEASRFYNNLRSIGEHKVELDGLRHDRKGAEAAEYFRENREAMLVPMATKMQSDVSKLNKLKRELITKDASPERIKIIDAQITQKMKMLNDRVRSLRAKEPA